MTHSRRRQGIRTTRMAAIGLIMVAILAGGAPAQAARKTIIPTPTVGGRIALFSERGQHLGYLARLGGCSVGAIVVGPESWNSVDLHLGRTTSTPCVLDHGRLARSFMNWLDASLRGSARPQTFQIASYTTAGVPVSAIELRGARLTSLELPALDVASPDAISFRSTLIADEIGTVAVPDFPGSVPRSSSALRANQFAVEVDGTAQKFVRTVSSLDIDALFGDGIRDPREGEALRGVFHPGGLLIVAGSKGRKFLEEWLDKALAGEPETERTMTITYLDSTANALLVIELQGVGISGADSGLDPAKRAFGFYVEGVSISFPAA